MCLAEETLRKESIQVWCSPYPEKATCGAEDMKDVAISGGKNEFKLEIR